MNDVRDLVVLVTGGSNGIGAGIVRTVLARGAKHVVILDINITQGQALEAELNSKYGINKVKFIKCDVASNELHAAFEEAVQLFGYLDVVINNAGIMNDSPQVYEKEITINFTAVITGSLKAFEIMRKDRNGKGGTIVNISSVVALIQSSLLPVYSATKSAVLQFSNCLGKIETYNRTGVRVVTVCFGATDTSLIVKVGCIDKELEEMVPAAMEKMPLQGVDAAVSGLIHAFENGASGSTWLVTSGRPAEEITGNVTKAYEILSQGVYK
ncbi:putative alcohol dehydrogenase [Danaus plexippus plexippus]|uniref:15-hydroxyprostaglandin dehydrogenase [NAD(+)] n=1 Tax=Danaus plexippus plexippus TaxID=278856 RepID=A0A212F0G1_DANPL|nr:putative alcohol dehydrogenase [Danaus plexippus plexippus]